MNLEDQSFHVYANLWRPIPYLSTHLVMCKVWDEMTKHGRGKPEGCLYTKGSWSSQPMKINPGSFFGKKPWRGLGRESYSNSHCQLEFPALYWRRSQIHSRTRLVEEILWQLSWDQHNTGHHRGRWVWSTKKHLYNHWGQPQSLKFAKIRFSILIVLGQATHSWLRGAEARRVGWAHHNYIDGGLQEWNLKALSWWQKMILINGLDLPHTNLFTRPS